MSEEKMIKKTLWEGKLKIEGVVENEEERLVFNSEEFNYELLYEIIKKLKPKWRATFVYSIVGELECLKLDLLCLLRDVEDEEQKENE